MIDRLLWVAACVLLPVIWGVIVHRLFETIGSWSSNGDDPTFPDYQI